MGAALVTLPVAVNEACVVCETAAAGAARSTATATAGAGAFADENSETRSSASEAAQRHVRRDDNMDSLPIVDVLSLLRIPEVAPRNRERTLARSDTHGELIKDFILAS